ncbi:hypothetical protein [Halosimplex amylolyticum]|uniref:hypothetical protein n=1 Tax=Halosimplex amylolyticum TaxID=3396616 RepID=UPI003F54F658
MDGAWFTDAGERGEITIERRDDSWFVASPGDIGQTKCVIAGGLTLDDATDEQTITATVTNFRRGIGDRPHFLFVESSADATGTERQLDTGTDTDSESKPTASDGNRNADSPADDRSASANELRALYDFGGTGDYVDVDAVVDSIHYVDKETNGTPDVRGELVDDSVLEPVTFIVNDGVSHPFFEEGTRFRFENVKDHYYSKKAEVQVVVNRNTEFTELER